MTNSSIEMNIEIEYIFLTLIIGMSAALAFMSYRQKYLQPTVSVFICTAILAVLVKVSLSIGSEAYQILATQFTNSIYFHDIVVNVLLSYLLFAGSLHVSTTHFKKYLKEIMLLAFPGTCIAFCITSTLCYFIMSYISPLNLTTCLFFAAAISPTDPIAVLTLLKNLKISKNLEVKIAAESLLNDGVGIVIFTTILEFATNSSTPALYDIAKFFTHEVIGGLLLGYIVAKIGVVAFRHDNSSQTKKEDIVWTIALLNISQFTAIMTGVSPALTAVSLGLSIGSFFEGIKVDRANSLMQFWDIIDELLNFIIFFLLGLEVIRLDMSDYTHYATLGILAIVITSCARYISVHIPLIFSKYNNDNKNLIALGGIKGGLSLALASIIPDAYAGKSSVMFMTYSVVAFTLIIQTYGIQVYINKKQHLLKT